MWQGKDFADGWIKFANKDEAVAYAERNIGAIVKYDPFCDETKTGIFRSHSCWKCSDGAKPCVQAGRGGCEYPHARND